EVVGVNTAIYSPNGGSVGIAFAIPAATVNKIANDLIKSGSVTRGYLGVQIQDVTKDIADSVGLKSAKGALVTEPRKDSPAANAGITVMPNSDGTGLVNQDIDPESVAAQKGLAVGDNIVEVDNKPVTTAKEFQAAIDAVKASGRPTALVKSIRGGETRFLGLP